ncbi:MAG: redox-regulated ATPase YchF [Bacteriovoracaceae bacterium]|jgi:ribosome-binding ATPase|nr:redox-regulated ATPase YchF [Bacteriovoracaceae bacterium]
MALKCGIVGLPNVGKSTIFQALTSAPAEAANYPFCTIEPNLGVVTLSDKRMDKIGKIIGPKKMIPTIVEFLDIAGLVKGASQGEGLGNQFLGHIRQVNAIVHVVRCFDDSEIVHVSGRIDPIDDIEIINIELALADYDSVKKRLDKLPKEMKNQKKEISSLAKVLFPILEKLAKELEEGRGARTLDFSEEELELLGPLNLITLKETLYLCNVDENAIAEDNKYIKLVKEHAIKENAACLSICGKLESEIASLTTVEEKEEFLEAAGIQQSGIDILSHTAYKMLGLRTYFTAGVQEVRAWTFKSGDKAPQAAGVIHTDFEKGFIKAEVFHCEDLFNCGTEAKVKEAGKFRVEGKEYVVQDGDIMHFRFNV